MKYITITLLVLVSFLAQAQLKTWDGGAGTHNWEDANNWSPDGVPTILNDVEIDNDSISINSNRTVKSILLESTHATETNQALFLQNGFTLSVFNSTSSGLELDDGARFWNAGSLIIVGAGSSGIRIFSGTFENMANQGFIAVSLCGEGLTNRGTFQNRNNAEIDISDISGIGLDNAISSSQFSNRGEITISEINIGVNNIGTLLNRGDLLIDNVSYIGMVTINYFKNFSTGLVTLDSLDDEGIFASYDFINEGDLTIKTAMKNGIEDTFYPLSLVNSGYIYISKAEENGILMDTTGSFIHNMVGGEILIDSTTAEGIFTNQKLINEGNIEIASSLIGLVHTGTQDSLINSGLIKVSSSQGNGIRTDDGGVFINLSSGIIEIDSSDDNGLAIRARFVNDGEIIVQHSTEDGIELRVDTLINNGQISIINAENGIFHEGMFLLNGLNGEISIDSTGEEGLYLDGADFTNYGILRISNTGAKGLVIDETISKLTNKGLVTIKNTGEAGLENFEGYLLNTSTGEITIDSTTGSGFYNYSIFTNDGTLNVSNTSYYGLANVNQSGTPDSLVNNGIINIKNTSNIGLWHSGDLLYNSKFAEINLDSNANMALYLTNKFVNDGDVNIINALGYGLIDAALNSDSLINSGSLKIENSVGVALQLQGTYFINGSTGEISIDSSASDGVSVSKGKFNNEGSLHISKVQNGLVSSPLYSDTLINTGLIDIKESEAFIIQNRGNVFLNDACGKMKLQGTIENSATFLNKGLIEGPNVSWHFASSDSLINDGTIYLRTVPTSPLLKNNGHLIKPIKGTLSEGIKEMNVAISGSSPLNAIPVTWWADEALTLIGGTYDDGDKSFTPTAAGLATDTLWVEQNNGSCSVVLSVLVNQTSSCLSYLSSTFTGAVSFDWHTAENWNKGYVPNACTIAIIPAAQNCIITTGRKARAFRIEAEAGSMFDAQLGAVLDVNPSN